MDFVQPFVIRSKNKKDKCIKQTGLTGIAIQGFLPILILEGKYYKTYSYLAPLQVIILDYSGVLEGEISRIWLLWEKNTDITRYADRKKIPSDDQNSDELKYINVVQTLPHYTA